MRLAGLSSSLWKRVAMLALATSVFAALAIGPLHVATGSYDGRNGAAEALDDAVVGLPPKLYEHRNDQIGPGAKTPGIYCPGSAQSSAFWKLKRVSIEEANFAEGRVLSRTEWRRAQAARAFAYLYNTTMYDVHQSKLKRACPGIRLEPFTPHLKGGG
jgi:hypothetical protein